MQSVKSLVAGVLLPGALSIALVVGVVSLLERSGEPDVVRMRAVEVRSEPEVHAVPIRVIPSSRATLRLRGREATAGSEASGRCSSSRVQVLSADATDLSTVRIDAPLARLSVAASRDDGRIVVRARKCVPSPELLNRIRVSLERTGQTAHLNVLGPASSGAEFGEESRTVDLDVRLPEGVETQIVDAEGGVQVVKISNDGDDEGSR